MGLSLLHTKDYLRGRAFKGPSGLTFYRNQPGGYEVLTILCKDKQFILKYNDLHLSCVL